MSMVSTSISLSFVKKLNALIIFGHLCNIIAGEDNIEEIANALISSAVTDAAKVCLITIRNVT